MDFSSIPKVGNAVKSARFSPDGKQLVAIASWGVSGAIKVTLLLGEPSSIYILAILATTFIFRSEV